MQNNDKRDLSEVRITQKLPTCGLVMPISPIEDCSAEHWLEVQGILKDVIKSCNLDANLVSDADESGIIQKRIIQNLYNYELVICDVSCKNPNVMFELGLRLAFDKATIIIKDDKTAYTFDTGVIEHLSYPRDLRFGKINLFKENLKKKIEATLKASKDPNYSTFLKSFGEYKVSKLASNEVTIDKYVLDSLDEMKKMINGLRTANIESTYYYVKPSITQPNQPNKVYSGVTLMPKTVNDLKEALWNYYAINTKSISKFPYNSEEKSLLINHIHKYLLSQKNIDISASVVDAFLEDEINSTKA